MACRIDRRIIGQDCATLKPNPEHSGAWVMAESKGKIEVITQTEATNQRTISKDTRIGLFIPSADNKFYAPVYHLSLPAHASSGQISYNAVRLSDPEAVRFSCKPQKADKGSHEAAAATPVTYRNFRR